MNRKFNFSRVVMLISGALSISTSLALNAQAMAPAAKKHKPTVPVTTIPSESTPTPEVSAKPDVPEPIPSGLPTSPGETSNGDTSSSQSINLSRSTKALDKNLGFQFSSTPNEAQNGVDTSFHGTVLGKQRSLFQYSVEANPITQEGVATPYINGVQLPSVKFPVLQGSYQTHLAVPPLSSNITVLAVPVGPLMITVNGGFSLKAGLDATISPTIYNPIQNSLIQMHIEPQIQALAFAEGGVTLLILRGGVGGEVTLIDADLQLDSSLYLGSKPSTFKASGFVDFLSGRFYAFADYFNPLRFKWSKLLKHSLYEWKGLCHELGAPTETSGTCATLRP